MIEVLVWGAVLRFCQALLQASPTILVGLLVAGVLRRLLGYQGTRRLFGQGSNWALLLAWLIGMLLPVCSLGVIPILRQMRRAGVSGGTILAFALTAPLFNPISVLYGLTLSNPLVIITFCFCCLVIVTTIGLVWDRLFPNTAVQDPEPPAVAYGIKRIAAVAVTSADELAGRASLFMAIGLIGVAALSILGAYIYYPPPSEIFEELRIVHTEVVASANSRDWDTTGHWIPIQQDWIRKLQVSNVSARQRADHRSTRQGR